VKRLRSQREREKEKERGRERERKEREKGRKRERKWEGERGKEIFYFFKGMTGALAPFSYLVYKYLSILTIHFHRNLYMGTMNLPIRLRYTASTFQ